MRLSHEQEAELLARRYVALLLDDPADYAAVIDFLTRRLAHEPRDLIALHNRAVALLESGRTTEGRRDLDHAVSRTTDDAMPAIVRGRLNEGAGDLGRAVDDYSRAIEIEPANPGHWVQRGSVLATCGRVSEAIEDYDRAEMLGSKVAEAARRALLRSTAADS